MPRKHRTCEPNLTYHIVSRCIESRDMIDDYFKDILVVIISKTQEIYEFELIHYAILNNHFHFIIRTTEEGPPISRIIQYIKARFAETYNRFTDRKGTFWSERYKDVIVEKQGDPETYLLRLIWYIGYNPVKKRYVSKPEKYRYSSLRCYLEEMYSPPVEITLHQLFLQLGQNFQDRARRFWIWGKFYRVQYSTTTVHSG